MQLHKIIVPFDFTEASFNTLEIAAQLAKKDDAVVSVIYVVDVPVSTGTAVDGMTGSLGNIGTFISRPHDSEEEKGALLLHMVPQVRERYEIIKERYAHVKFEEHVKPDSYQKHLYKFITNEKADLTILKTSQASDVKSSDAAEIIRHSANPVMTIHRQDVDFHPKNIVFESDFINVDTEQINYLKYFRDLFNADIHLLKVITPSLFSTTKELRPVMENFAKEAGLDEATYHIINAHSVEEGVLDFTDLNKADLIIKSEHSHSALTKWFYSSAIESLAIHANVPVITI